MLDLAATLIKSYISILAIMNPVGLLPIYYFLTQDYSKEEIIELLKTVFIYVLLIIFTFCIFGDYIFALFGISIDAFKIAGGLLLLKIAWDMLHAEISRIHHHPKEKEDVENIAIVPLATPLLAGPGTITTSMLLVNSTNSFSLKIISYIAIILASLTSVFILYNSKKIMKILNQAQINAIIRLMGLLILALSVQIICSGIKGLFF
jgi:multiple antibiotic resistance protein